MMIDEFLEGVGLIGQDGTLFFQNMALRKLFVADSTFLSSNFIPDLSKQL